MRYKKIMMLTIILTCLLAISVVSATENVTDDVISADASDDVVSVEETTDEVVSVENNNQTIDLATDGSDSLSVNSDGTFTDLANEIANANGELVLTKNYVYDPNKDSNYKNGIIIKKAITINGKGFVINGNDDARAFYVAYTNVTLKNIKFTNCYSYSSSSSSSFTPSYGGAIYWNETNGRIFYCNFINCHSSISGGAIYWNGVNGSIFDCNLVNCRCYSYSSNAGSSSTRGSISGGAIYWNGANGNLINSNFENCFNYIDKSNSDYSGLSSSSSSSYGGVIYWNGVNGNLINASFENCSSYSSSDSSSYHWGSSYDILGASSSSDSSSYGGVIYWNGVNGNLINASFENCSSSSSSHSSASSTSTSNYCSYSSSSSSSSYGGAIYWVGKDGYLSDCSFVNCLSSSSSSSYCPKSKGAGASSISYNHGHAVYWYGNNGNIFNSIFVNSSDSTNSNTVYWLGVKENMFNCSFNGNCYNYQEFCKAENDVYPVLFIYQSTFNNDNRIVIFESTPLVNNISVSIYDVKDKITLYKQFYISSEDLSSSFTVNDLEEGEYQIVLEYGGDNFYSTTSANNFFKIGKNSSFEVMISDDINVGDNVTLNLTLNEDATGRVKITSSDYTYVKELVDGKTSFNIPNVSSGINTYKLKYEGDGKYNPLYITNTFNVFLKSNISLNLKENNVFSESIALNYAITPSCTGIISIFVDNEFKTNISVGEQFELENIPAGEHNITVIYNGDEYYSASKDSTILTVSKADSSIKVNSSNIPGPVSFEVILNEKATGNVNVTINNNSYSENLTNGKVNIIIPNLNAGTYSARVYYNGDNNYNARIYDTELTINKIPTTVVGTAEDITYSQNAIINVRGSVEGVVVVKIGENYINNISVMANTLTPISFENIPNGKHNIAITLKPTNANYAESTYNTEFTVSKKQTSVIANVEDITYSEKAIINVKASVDGIAVVKIDETYINNVNVIANTIAPVSFENIPSGKHDVTITLKPTNTNYDQSTYNTEFSVSIKETSIRLNVVDSVYGKDVIVNVTASEDGKVILKMGDITKEKIVFANTQTKFNFGVLAANSYNVEVSFDAGENYRQSNQQSSFTISPAKSEIVTIQTQNNIYGENTIIKVKTNVAGVLSVKLNNSDIKTFNIDANKLTTLDLGKYDVDNYNIDLTLDAGLNYIKSTGNAKVTVNPKQTTVKVNADNSVYGNKVIVKVTASENGKVTVQIGNIVKSVNVDANKVASVDFGILDVNSYEVSATFDGGKNFNTSSDKTTLAISPKASSVTIVDSDNQYIYSKNVVINVKADATGTLTVKLGDKTQTKQVIAGNIVSFDFGVFDVNKYDVKISLDAGNNYIPSQNTASITINPKSTVVTLNTKEYGADEKVIVNVTASEKGIVTIKLESIVKTVNVNANVLTSVDLGILDTGSYVVVANFTAGNNYVDSSNSNTIKVLSKIKDEDVNITIPEIKANQENNIVISLPADATGTVTLTIGNNSYTFTVKNGIADIKVPKLADGNYDYKINYSGDNKYSSFENTGNIDVAKPAPEIVVPPLDKPSDDGSVAINLPSDASGTITLVIDKKPYSFPVVNGVANIYLPDLNNGDYNYTITYSGDGRYSAFTNTGSVKINKIIATVLTVPGVTTVYNGNGYLKITLKDENGNVVSDVQLTVSLNGKNYAPITDKNGQAKLTTNGLAPKAYTATIKFAGNTNYASATKNVKVTVKKAAPKLTAKAKTLKRSDKTKKYTVTLKTNQNKVMKNTKITIKVNKKTYTAKTNSKGVATFKLTKLTKKGKYTATVSYAGSKYYNAKSVKVKITVK